MNPKRQTLNSSLGRARGQENLQPQTLQTRNQNTPYPATLIRNLDPHPEPSTPNPTAPPLNLYSETLNPDFEPRQGARAIGASAWCWYEFLLFLSVLVAFGARNPKPETRDPKTETLHPISQNSQPEIERFANNPRDRCQRRKYTRDVKRVQLGRVILVIACMKFFPDGLQNCMTASELHFSLCDCITT